MSLRCSEPWPDTACPVPIEYSKAAFEQLRRLAVAGLEALPRVGLGIGGLLLGTRDEGRISILDSLSLPCRHGLGPGFVLEPDELGYAVDVVRHAGPLLVVGWYCSKPRVGSLSDGDAAVWDRLCPESRQIALVLRPRSSGDSLASIHFRDGAGNIVAGTECPLEPFDTALAQVPTPLVKPVSALRAVRIAAAQSDPA